MDDMTIYYRHYLTVDERGRITDGWSNGPHYDRDTTGAILLTEQGSYQFRLWADGEDNPTLWTFPEQIPLYKWNGEAAERRTNEEIEADRAKIPVPELEPTAQDDTDAMLIDHELRLTMLELGITEY